jgi:hypothetical protein
MINHKTNSFVLQFILIFAFSILCCDAYGREKGLSAHYTFNESGGKMAKDQSGRKNHGEIKGKRPMARRVKGRFGSALRFDGKDDYVDCGIRKDFSKMKSGTIVLWVKPDMLKGGLVTQSTGRDYVDSRLVLSFKGSQLAGLVSDGKNYKKHYFGTGLLESGKWSQVAFTFGKSGQVTYVDGIKQTMKEGSIEPDHKGLPLLIGSGKLFGSGRFFKGLIADVRIYDHALTEKQLLSCYRKLAGKMGKDTKAFSSPDTQVLSYPDVGKIVVFSNIHMMQSGPKGKSLKISLREGKNGKNVIEKTALIQDGAVELIIDASKLLAGDYVLAINLFDAKGNKLGKQAENEVKWKGLPVRQGEVKVLNNFVMELLHRQLTGKKESYKFINPRDGWVFISTGCNKPSVSVASVSLDGKTLSALTLREIGSNREFETIRYLKKGEHEVDVSWNKSVIDAGLVVRSVPDILYVYYPRSPKIKAHGPYDWDFLSKDILPNTTTLITTDKSPPNLKLWKTMGRNWVSICHIPNLKGGGNDSANKAYKYWMDTIGMQEPLMSGILVDEFLGGDLPVYDAYTKAVQMLSRNKKLKGRTFNAYSTLLYGSKRSERFTRAVVAGGGSICWEQYFGEYRSLSKAKKSYHKMVMKMVHWQKAFPGIMNKMAIVLGYLEQPTYSQNYHPSIDFKVGMDMQYNLLATHPVFFGLGGLSQWASSYADEETIRWSGRLYRHYCIEGKTEPLTRDPYETKHLTNPDFEKGLDGWTVQKAEPCSIAAKSKADFGYLQARSKDVGNNFIWTRRSATRPNVFSQEIKNLQPGRWYSLKVITADYQNLMNGVSEKEPNSISITITGADVDESRNFQYTFPQHYGRKTGPFKRENMFWMNYHWRVFQAKSKTAKLSISDWTSKNKPGGPAGEELIYNFIEIQPYLK